MSTPPLDGHSNWRRGELPRGDSGRHIWDHSPSKSSDGSSSPSRAVALFPARPALHSAFPIVESADSSSEVGDGKADDEGSERSTLDWSQDSVQPSSGPHTPSAQRLAATSRGQFDWKPTMNQFSEKLRRDQNNIKFFDEETPEAAGILKLVEDDDDELMKSQRDDTRRRSPQRGPHNSDATKRRPADPAGERVPSVPLSRDAFPAHLGSNQQAAPPQPVRIPTSITESIAHTNLSRATQPPHVPRSITDVMARPKSSARASVPASITDQFVSPVQRMSLPPQAFSMTIAELVALARQALPPASDPSSPPVQSPPLPVQPVVPTSITQLLPNQPPVPTSITDLFARSPGSPAGNSAASGLSSDAWSPFNSSPGTRSPSSLASSLSSSSPPPSFAGYPTVTTNTIQNRLSSPNMYNSRPSATTSSKGPIAQQAYNWGPVSPPSRPTYVNAGPIPPIGLLPDAIPRSMNGAGRHHAGAYAQWPGSQYSVPRN
ncbi:unnamed protein product [Peniophora sp. CBMAI 1063]|nr:unnamed protein product [Peniophora sp. CBMAI 1063]